MYEQRAKILARGHRRPADRRSIEPARWIAVLAAVLMLGAALHSVLAADLPHAIDLERSAREAATEGKVLVVLYGTATCPWCAKVRRNYLAPLAGTGAAVFIEIDLEVAMPLKDFSGRATDHRTFARSQQVRIMPTVAMYGPKGEALAEPLISMSSEDFYGAYLEERLAIATRHLKKNQ